MMGTQGMMGAPGVNGAGAPGQGMPPQNGVPMQGGMPMQSGVPMPNDMSVQNGVPMPNDMLMQNGVPMQYSTSMNGMPAVQQIPVPVEPEKDISSLVKIIAIIVLSLLAVTFIGLFIWMMLERNEAQSDLDGKINAAVLAAKDEQSKSDRTKCQQEKEYPYMTFVGPEDYGRLSFQYPKTWSVYIDKPATTGGDFNAYMNPIQVDAVSENTINALRVTILNKSFETVTQEYQRIVDRRESNLTVRSIVIGPTDNQITANIYEGTIPNTELSGYIVTFKIRDKTAILQTDSVLFKDAFDKLLTTVTFNT